MNTSELIKFEKEKNSLAKGLADHKEHIAIRTDKRKKEYTQFLYSLKMAYTDKMFDQSITRIDKIHMLRK